MLDEVVAARPLSNKNAIAIHYQLVCPSAGWASSVLKPADPNAMLIDNDFHLHFVFGLQVSARPMDNRFVDIRTQLAASAHTRVEIGEDGVLHVLAGPVTLHLERAVCEELTTTLARAMLALARSTPKRRAPALCLVGSTQENTSDQSR